MDKGTENEHTDYYAAELARAAAIERASKRPPPPPDNSPSRIVPYPSPELGGPPRVVGAEPRRVQVTGTAAGAAALADLARTGAPDPRHFRAHSYLDLTRGGQPVRLSPGILEPNTLTDREAEDLIARGVLEVLEPDDAGIAIARATLAQLLATEVPQSAGAFVDRPFRARSHLDVMRRNRPTTILPGVLRPGTLTAAEVDTFTRHGVLSEVEG